MKDKIVIVGGGEHANVLIGLLKKLNTYEILGYTDIINKGSILGTEYLGNDELLIDINKKNKNCNAIIGIGNIKVSTKRNRIYEMLKNIGFEMPTIVSENAILNDDIMIGEGTVVLDNVIINSSSTIGKCALLYSNSVVEHHCIVGDFVNFATGSIIAAGSKIGSNSVLSVGAIIASHKIVVDNCFIGVGSVVISDILKEGTYFGVPARKINF